MPETRIRLTTKEKSALMQITSVGRENARTINRAFCLLNLQRGLKQSEIAAFLGKSERFVRAVKARYLREGLSSVFEKSRPGQPEVVSQSEKLQIIAMVSARPPDGHARWTVRLIASEASKRGLVRTVGKDTVRKILREADLKPWREKNVGYPQGTFSGVQASHEQNSGAL